MLVEKIINRLRKTYTVANDPSRALKLLYRHSPLLSYLQVQIKIAVAHRFEPMFKPNIHFAPYFIRKRLAEWEAYLRT